MMSMGILLKIFKLHKFSLVYLRWGAQSLVVGQQDQYANTEYDRARKKHPAFLCQLKLLWSTIAVFSKWLLQLHPD